LVYPKQLKAAVELVAAFPRQPFVLDHLAKPQIAETKLSPWREDLQKLALFPNVHCKLSGMATEAKWRQWRPSDFEVYLDIVLGAFGWARLMIGSDWPVCMLSGEYSPVMNVVIDYVKKLPVEAQAGILGDNCAHFYKIDSYKRRTSLR
jgi:L-fuconolactonase